MRTFAIILKKEREILKMSQKEMADKLKITLRAYQNYESLGINHCEPDQELLIKMASILNVTVGYLLGCE
jgi:transcriptional regulator with XRE-family HTH domain